MCKLSLSYMYFYPSVITGQRKPGAILTSTPGVASDFSPTVNFQCRLSFFLSFFFLLFFSGGGGGGRFSFIHYNKHNTCQYICSNSFMVFVQLPRATTCVNIYMHVKHPKCWKSYHYSDTQKYCTHGWEWVPLLLWLLYPYKSKQPKLSTRDQWGIKTNISSKRNKNSFIVLFTFSCAMSWCKCAAMFGLGWRSSVVLYWVVSSFLTRLFWPMYHSKPEAF